MERAFFMQQALEEAEKAREIGKFQLVQSLF